MRGFFIRICGITGLALRASLRTRTVGAIIVLLLACIFLLPYMLKGDGSPAGELQVLFTYTLGFAFGLLALASLWTACSLFAAEIDSTRIQLTTVKPVRVWEQWFGKWLALLILNGLALLVVYLGAYAQIRWRIHRDRWEAIERPTSRYVARPILPTPAEEAKAVYAEMAEAGQLPTNLTKQAILRVLREKAAERYSIVNPGEEVAWQFALERPIAAGDPVTVRVRFDTEYSTRTHIQGTFRIACDEAPGTAIEVPVSDFSQNEIEFAVDSKELLPEPLSPAPPLRHFTLAFANQSQARESSAIMLRFRQDVALLTPGGTFEANLLRSAVIHWSVLGLFSALGLTLSACLSFPVAAFTATLLLVLCMLGNSVVEVIAEEDKADWKNKPGIWVSQVIHYATVQAFRESPLTSITRNERINTKRMLSAAGWDLVAMPFYLAALGCVVLSRRELN
ncbi:MAG: hypothetical protein J6334_11255 [Kiritimatiellae bacterium]|nr:hypothetical protein [Kiritimatiellia bacterium]